MVLAKGLSTGPGSVQVKGLPVEVRLGTSLDSTTEHLLAVAHLLCPRVRDGPPRPPTPCLFVHRKTRQW